MIPPEELEITMPDASRGGQHVGMPRTLRIVHIPTGLAVEVDTHMARSQHRALQVAKDMLLAGITNPLRG